MRILIVGNMGYVGSVLVRHLRSVLPQAELIGFDTGFFAHNLTNAMSLPEVVLNKQIYGDIRKLPPDLCTGVDAVINLAAISNDPMGNKFEAVTEDINQKCCLQLAEAARAAGVKSFVFASSCSIYGYAAGAARKESDQTNPLTAYARSKVGAEKGLQASAQGEMVVTCLRFATACGMSDRLRLDLVVNDFVACALATGEITILSDGSPWRPLIDVKDMARAMEWAVARKASEGGQYLVINAGADDWNYQVRDVAQAVMASVPKAKAKINSNAPPDKRSYKVDFALFRSLAPQHQPKVIVTDCITNMRDNLMSMGFNDKNFRNSRFIRLKVLEDHMKAQRLGEQLRWIREYPK